MAKIKLQMRATIEETFKDFIVSKRSKGLAEKTLESYQFHFHSIEKHLDVTQDVATLQKEDLEMMIAEMRGAGLAAIHSAIQSAARRPKDKHSLIPSYVCKNVSD